MKNTKRNSGYLVYLMSAVLFFFIFVNSTSAVTLGISGNRFTLDGSSQFLVFSGYWDGLDAPNPSTDLSYLHSKGFDGIRIYPLLWDYGGPGSYPPVPEN